MTDFKDLTPTLWAGWIVRCVLGLESDPPLQSSREKDPRLRLIPLVQDLDSAARLRFEEGLALALESTPPRQENARQLYYLLDLVSYFTPFAGKLIVRQLLFGGTLKACQYQPDGSRV